MRKTRPTYAAPPAFARSRGASAALGSGRSRSRRRVGPDNPDRGKALVGRRSRLTRPRSPRQQRDAGWLEHQKQSSLSAIVRDPRAMLDVDLGGAEHRSRGAGWWPLSARCLGVEPRLDNSGRREPRGHACSQPRRITGVSNVSCSHLQAARIGTPSAMSPAVAKRRRN